MALPYIGGLILNNVEVDRQRFFPDDPFEFSDRNFVKLYRLRKQDVENLEEMLEPFLPVRNRVDAITNRVKILTSLRVFAGGSYQLDVGRNHCMMISQPSVSRCLHEVLDAINQPAIVNRFCRYPITLQELRNLRERFFEETNVAGICGIIDCTHIALTTPEEDEHIYVNRKNFHSLNVQMICDEKMKILNVNARYPGSTHDSFIWRNSRVEELLRTMPDDQLGNFYLLGDSGYPLRPWLMTPYLTEPAPGTPEARFNVRMRQIRVLIERCFGLLKNRFRCLLKDRVLHYAPITVAKIVTACTVLHNICVENNIPLIEDEEWVNELDGFENALEEEMGRNMVNDNFLQRGRMIRNFLARTYF